MEAAWSSGASPCVAMSRRCATHTQHGWSSWLDGRCEDVHLPSSSDTSRYSFMVSGTLSLCFSGALCQ